MGVFKKSFLSKDQLRDFAPPWAQKWAKDHELYSQGLIHPAEFCARMVLDVYRSLYGPRFTNGRRHGDWSFPGNENFEALGLLGRMRVRALPESAGLALLRWATGEIELKVFEGVPTPMEVLTLQTRGIRCLTVLHRERDLLRFRHEGRDFFSFLIHDLIHAQLMTENEEGSLLQKKFARVIHQGWGVLNTGLSEVALSELEYMASDMNSHIVHLTKTLKSWTERHRSDLTHREEFSRLWRALDHGDQEKAHVEIFEMWKRLDI